MRFSRGHLSTSFQRILKDPGLPFRRLSRSFDTFFENRPTSYPFVSGDTFRQFSNFIFDEAERVLPSDLSPGDIVFCGGDFIREFSHEVLRELPFPIVVVLGNSDRNYSRADGLFLPQTPRHRFFAQNLLEPIPFFEPIPIGLENLHWRDMGRPKDFLKRRKFLASRDYRIMWTFTVRTNKPIRKLAAEALKASSVADFLGQVPPDAHRDALARFAFVAAPPGNGWDTHRMWEAMYLGCIPIVLDSEFAQEFVRQGLPIWIVESYFAVSEVTEEALEAKYRGFRTKLDSPLLWFDHWSNKLLECSEDMKERWHSSK